MGLRSWFTGTALAVLLSSLMVGQALADDSNYTLTTVASSGDVGRYTAIAKGNNGPVIAYYDKTNAAVKLVVCGDTNCTADNATKQTLYHDILDPGTTIDVAVKSDGIPVVVYLNKSNNSGDEIYYIECTNATCSEHPTVYSIGTVVGESADLAVAINSADEALVAYTYSDTVVYLVQCMANQAGCVAEGQALFLLSDYTSPRELSLSLNSEGFPLLGYIADNGTDSALQVINCDSALCTEGEEPTTAATAVGTSSMSYASVAGAKNGTKNAVGTYYDSSAKVLNVVSCAADPCTDLTTNTIYSGDAAVKSLDLAVRKDGMPAVSFAVKSGDKYKLKLAQCSDAACAAVSNKTLDSSASVGLYNSITFVSKKRAAISYYDSTNKNLKVAVKKKS